ncbi:DNA mismatch repair endonuclease MutL [Paenibacillus nasutitermitis]|uniref:DNA mismatch repair protein MutL n=1 Tax=Paenibacillus nasutitermitis TaxID=1652958 RepID=A0A916YW02_9BACL|nr:DNA mismatch repair endonuclease MutL [Paenibacillus nasutitermitis]GGD64065.1 DNA mismatch repair protein MutL [Paenibacillus nasutitermitis]
MAKINILDEQLANQIAAGEVVERPSSVVKELVENAIDAGSTTIDIVIEEGGLSLVRVTDNGSGIDPEDIPLAFYRHATSKISSGRDLFRIASLGFRGEALPSIAAVAKVECISSTETTGLGRRLVIEGGAIVKDEDHNAPQGTDIAVRDLFYNTPARLKYMKTIQTEIGHIADYVNRLALAHPGIAITLKHNGGLLLRTLGSGDRLQTFAAIYGTTTAKAMLSVEGEHPDYDLRGIISKPEQTRANRNGITVVVNGRYIRSYVINQSIMQAYHTLLPINRYPLAVLELGMHPSLLDVNVHPSKMEVRFSKEPELRQFIEQVIVDALGKQRHIPGPASGERSKPAFIQERISFHQPEPSASPDARISAAENRQEKAQWGGMPAKTGHAAPYNSGSAGRGSQDWQSGRSEIPADATERLYAPPSRRGDSVIRETAAAASMDMMQSDSSTAGSSVHPSAASGRDESALNQRSVSSDDGGRSLTDQLLASGDNAGSAGNNSSPDSGIFQSDSDRQAASSAGDFPELYWVGQLHGTYIVAQNEDGMYLIDQHAAHERIHYEYFFEKFSHPEQASQQLLVPITLEFTPTEASALRERLGVMEQAGVELEPFGSHAFLVRAYPQWLPEGEEQSVVEEMVEWLLGEKAGVDIGKLREKSAIMCSCKASIKANDRLTREQGEGLIRRLANCHQPYTCPHGRPIVVHMSTYQLEKMFKRVMS